jgi:Helicase HerA, central domain
MRLTRPQRRQRGSPREPQPALAPGEDLPCAEAEGERGVVLGSKLCGERALPAHGRQVVLSQQRLCRHLLVCGATGSGKTETVLRLAWAIAKSSEAPVFYLDAKGDRETAERFCGLMADAGRATRVFPNEPFDGWRGAAHELHGRLMEIVDYASTGPAAWYRDLAKAVLGLVCEHPAGPPRCARELLARTEYGLLSRAHPGSSTLAALTPMQVAQVRLRYEAFFAQTRGALDGDWCWEDTSAAYLLLDSLTLREETAGLARFLFEDFALYFTKRKPRSRFCLMIVDEFSALAERPGMAARIEQARGFHTGIVLVPQVLAGIGGETEAARILGSIETVICHRVNTPEQIVALAGARAGVEYTRQIDSGPSARRGGPERLSVRPRQEPKLDAEEIRSLPPGSAYVISRGRAMKARVLTAPERRAALPAALPSTTASPEHTPAREPPHDLPF